MMVNMKVTTGRRFGLASFMLLVLSGCTSGGSADRPQASATTSRSGDAGGPPCGAVRGRPVGCWDAASAPITSAPTSETTSARPASRACRVSDLEVRVEGSQGLGGTTYTPLVFKNLSSTACTLNGIPGSRSRTDRTSYRQATRTPLIDPPVTPGPGEIAIADLMVGSQRLGDCRPVIPATIRVNVGDGGAVTIAAGGFRFCQAKTQALTNTLPAARLRTRLIEWAVGEPPSKCAVSAWLSGWFGAECTILTGWRGLVIGSGEVPTL